MWIQKTERIQQITYTERRENTCVVNKTDSIPLHINRTLDKTMSFKRTPQRQKENSNNLLHFSKFEALDHKRGTLKIIKNNL